LGCRPFKTRGCSRPRPGTNVPGYRNAVRLRRTALPPWSLPGVSSPRSRRPRRWKGSLLH
jgi:hypothetical protein